MLRQSISVAALAIAFAAGSPAQSEEYQVKAAFLYNFAKFVEWPAPVAPSEPFVICILGQNPFGTALADAVREKVAGGRPFAVHLISDSPSKSSCQILFINSSDRQRFHSMAGNFKGSGMLTVGEASWFIADGGIINFKLVDGKIRFDISVQAAELAHLSISSKLLSLAQIVKK